MRSLPRVGGAYIALQSGTSAQLTVDYHIGALDHLNVSVFSDTDWSVKAVHAAGNFELRLIGTVAAAPLFLSKRCATILTGFR